MPNVSFGAKENHRVPAGSRTQDLVNTSSTEPLDLQHRADL